MAATEYPVNHPLAVKRWSDSLLKEALKRTYVMQFLGTDSNSLAQIKTEVNKAAGDRITFGLRAQLSGDGVQGDAVLEGNEEALVTYSQNVTIDQLRHAVKVGGKMSEQRVPFSVRDEARDGLADWWSARIDTWFFNQMTGNTGEADTRYTGNQATTAPDSDHQVFCGTGSTTTEAAISASSDQLFTLTLLDKAVEKAKLSSNALRPIRVGSQEYYVAFVHPYQVYDLRTNTNTGQWLDIQKAAMTGGDVMSNPIFSGALGVYNGVILHESTRLPTFNGAVASTVKRAVLCGAQSVMFAFGQGYGKGVYDWTEELFDYKNQLGVEAGCIGGAVKTRFNGSDFATVVISTRAVAH